MIKIGPFVIGTRESYENELHAARESAFGKLIMCLEGTGRVYTRPVTLDVTGKKKVKIENCIFREGLLVAKSDDVPLRVIGCEFEGPSKSGIGMAVE